MSSSCFYVYFGDQPSIRCEVGEDLFPLCRLLFILLTVFLALQKHLGFNFKDGIVLTKLPGRTLKQGQQTVGAGQKA